MSVIQASENKDRISDLPPNLTQHVLECLPLLDAVRTSILSRHWRYQWPLLQLLILNEPFFHAVLSKSSNHTMLTGSPDDLLAYLDIVNGILLRHISPIREFTLYVPYWFQGCEAINQWIEFVSSHGVEDLTLEISPLSSQRIPMPSCLFSAVGLTHLALLNCCIFSLPPTFKGFPSLISLEFELCFTCHLRVNTLEIFISGCTRLESLVLRHCVCEDLGHFVTTQAAIVRSPLSDHGLLKMKEAFSLEWLKHIKLMRIFDTSFELELIKFLLACSPALEVMTIEYWGGDEEKTSMAKELIKCRPWASRKAKVFFTSI